MNEVKRFQGIGRSVRDAKSKAAISALKKLKDYMPGCRVGSQPPARPPVSCG